jgi:pyruvate/2-oxoglutarate dehydrogenase complex dihydrolipoamide acyltransferase (E2) component
MCCWKQFLAAAMAESATLGEPSHIVGIKLPHVTETTQFGWVTWYKATGDIVQKGDHVGRLHTDHADPVTLVAPIAGKLITEVHGGVKAEVGKVIARIESAQGG